MVCGQPLSGVDLEQNMPHHFYIQLSNQLDNMLMHFNYYEQSICILGNNTDSHVYMHGVHKDRQVDAHMFTHGNTS